MGKTTERKPINMIRRRHAGCNIFCKQMYKCYGRGNLSITKCTNNVEPFSVAREDMGRDQSIVSEGVVIRRIVEKPKGL